ncbi:peroxiredoxin 5, atypical 2-Cys peroxiredoxin [[Emmonsia] crescens]|uniref:Peroxiredoxin 5, atypical 2-Cys peroxiredoxin n=1 Tax=[Emmonsia] crescens TaxID=73230 RepID=A0A2B7ZA57_9EURO|nr:peroxiredoxin 5, atypical 2-Cys peroxiredoxin [Emmonsia crescens]
MFATRRFAAKAIPRASHPAALFHTTRPSFVKVGDALPDLEVLTENSPGNKVNLAKELQGKGLIIGTPGAFSPACSAAHVPGFANHPKLKDAGKVFVVSVNDAFVTGAWSKMVDPEQKSGIRFLGDPKGEFTKALDLDFDASAIFGNLRSKRYVLVIEDGKVKKTFIEPDNTGLNGKKMHSRSLNKRPFTNNKPSS